MSMTTYPWDLEERVEDAVCAHIKNLCATVAMVVPSRTIAKAKYPLVVVAIETSANKDESREFDGRRVMSLMVDIRTEAINQNGVEGQIEKTQTAREHHRAVKSSVIGALAGKTVHDELNALGTEGVLFSMFAITTQTRDQGDGEISTMQECYVIAQPVEG